MATWGHNWFCFGSTIFKKHLFTFPKAPLPVVLGLGDQPGVDWTWRETGECLVGTVLVPEYIQLAQPEARHR